MDNLPYDIHEHILSFIVDKVDSFCYVDAYDNPDMWKCYALSLTKGIKNKYNKPRDITVKKDFKIFKIFERFRNDNIVVLCPCGSEFHFDKYTLQSKIKCRVNKHLETNIHKKNILNPKENSIKIYESCNEYFERVNRL